jgi:hypothetical protein
MKIYHKFRVNICASIIILVVASIMLPGCVGYRLGSSLPEGIEVVYIPTFINKTKEPLLEVVTSKAVISEIQRDGTLSIGNREKSDIILNVSVIDLKLKPLSYESDQTTTTSEYRMIITASLKLTNLSTGKVMTRNVVTGETDFVPVGDLSSAKRDALPDAAEDLAHSIVENVVEYW